MRLLNRLILHPFIFAIFPILTLLAYNITEVSPSVVLRSVVISLVATIILLSMLFLVTRNWKKATLTTTLILVLFFSYGQVYEFLQKNSLFGLNLGHHRFLVVIYILAFLFGLWVIFVRRVDPNNTTQFLMIIGILLLIYPAYQIISHTVHTSLSENRLAKISPNTDLLIPTDPTSLPDIYFIVLDGYTRSDALLNDYGFDNSSFLDTLRNMGFYVADCSRANNTATAGALEIALNMDYIPALRNELIAQGFNEEDIGILIKQSQVRKLLESIGYKTVAFDSKFKWSQISDADVYLQYPDHSFDVQVLQPFEALLIRSTALLLWTDAVNNSLADYLHAPSSGISFPVKDHANRQLFILDELPRLVSVPGPKFVFTHIIIPHGPFVFEANGDITTDSGFYSGKYNKPVDEEHLKQGYINEVQFINSRITEILQTIVTKSSVPPIVVVMGDHGLENENRFENLNAFYMPGDGAQNLYPTISPVNSFRLIFDTYFGSHFGLLPDISYDQFGVAVPETSPFCLQK
jgi:hypothetical protein